MSGHRVLKHLFQVNFVVNIDIEKKYYIKIENYLFGIRNDLKLVKVKTFIEFEAVNSRKLDF